MSKMLNNTSRMTPGLPYDWLVWEICCEVKASFCASFLLLIYYYFFKDSLKTVFLLTDSQTPQFWQLKQSHLGSLAVLPRRRPALGSGPGARFTSLWCLDVSRRWCALTAGNSARWAAGSVSTNPTLSYDAAFVCCGRRLLSPVLGGEWMKLIAVSCPVQ